MRQNCADACEKAANYDPNDAEAPPFDIWVVLLLGGFGAALVYAVRGAIQRDGELSHTVRRKTLAEGIDVGPGKPNKSAQGAKQRSAKKAR